MLLFVFLWSAMHAARAEVSRAMQTGRPLPGAGVQRGCAMTSGLKTRVSA
jgi:hypothetical protein